MMKNTSKRKSLFKRILSALVAAAMCAGMMPAVWADEGLEPVSVPDGVSAPVEEITNIGTASIVATPVDVTPPDTETNPPVTNSAVTDSVENSTNADTPTGNETNATVPAENEPSATVPTENEPSATVPTENEPNATVPTENEPNATVPTENEPNATVPTENEPNATVPTENEPNATVFTENDTNVTPPVDGQKPMEGFPVDGTEEEQQKWYQDFIDRITQTPGLDTSTGEVGDIPSNPEQPSNWTVFYDEKTGTYQLTYEIDEKAEGDQTVDLTKALELLGQYAQSATAPSKPQEPTAELTPEQEEELKAYETEQKAWEEEEYPYVRKMVAMMNDQKWVDTHTMEEIVNEFNTNPYREWYGLPSELKASIPVKPNISAEVDKDSQEYQDYLMALAQYDKDYEAYKRQLNANILQPGDIRKFDIYITSKSGHTYKYKDGSFMLTTPDLSGSPDKNPDDIKGFDGQILPDGDNGYVDKEYTYSVSAALNPIMSLMKGQGNTQEVKDIIEREIKAGHRTFEELISYLANNKDVGDTTVKKIADALGVTYTRTEATSGYDRIKYQFDDLSGAINRYLVQYYSNKDGKTYQDLADVFAHSNAARTDISATENVTQADKGFTFDGETFSTTYEASRAYCPSCTAIQRILTS